MFSLSTTEILILLIMSGGAGSTDLAALVQPAHYFKTRNVEPTIDRMIDFSVEEPKTPRLQLRQLTALRLLAERSDQFKKAKNYDTNRLAIEDIAQGKLGADPQGFAQEYARRLLAKLDGKATPAAKVGPMRGDALGWFPADTRFAWALDLRQPHGVTDDPVKDLLGLVPEHAKHQLYDILEKTGNVRVERVAFGVVDTPKENEQRVFMRITGKGNPAWVGDLLAAGALGGVTSRQIKAADGTPVRLLNAGRGSVAMLVGDTDLVFSGYYRQAGNTDDLVKEVLAVRAKKIPNAAAGPLKDRLAKVSDSAIAFAVADLTDEFRKGLNYLIDPCPAKISAYAERTAAGLDVKAETFAADANEAGKLVKAISEMRKNAIQSLQKSMQQPEIGGPPAPYQAIINLMESVQVQSAQDRVDVRGLVPGGLLPQLGRTSMYYDPPRGFEPPQEAPGFPKR